MVRVPAIPLDEQSLIRRAQQGESEAAAEIYRRHAALIYRYFLFRVGDRATA